ncbi:isocitrate lyase/phosphoenolpyruvate mutase family protein [Yinghuangia aomiensis]
MDIRTTVERARRLGQLHAEYQPLVLPTVWDVWSARTAVAAGFPALTIGSHPLADSRGAKDQEGQTFEEVLAAVRPIIAAVDVPSVRGLGGRIRTAARGSRRRTHRRRRRRPQISGTPSTRTADAYAAAHEHADYIAGLRAAARRRRDPGLGQRPHRPLPSRAGRRPASLDVGDRAAARHGTSGRATASTPSASEDDDALLARPSSTPSPSRWTQQLPVKHDLDRFRRLGVGGSPRPVAASRGGRRDQGDARPVGPLNH